MKLLTFALGSLFTVVFVPAAPPCRAAGHAAVMAPVTSAAGTLLVEPDMGRAPLLAAINAVSKSIDLAIYELTDPELTGALVKAAKRGVRVRVLYEYYSFKQAKRDPNTGAIKELDAAGAETRKASASFAHTHQKTFIFDRATALVMTFNLNAGHFSKMRDFGFLTSNSGQAAEIGQVFDADWNGIAAPPGNGTLVWSPDNARTKLATLIDSASVSLDIYSEEALDRGILKLLGEAVARGVRVRFLVPRLKGKGKNAAKDVNEPGRKMLETKGVQVKPDGALYWHAKLILADYGSAGQKAFLGSQNFSQTSLDKNRELGVIFEDPALLRALDAVFARDWGGNR